MAPSSNAMRLHNEGAGLENTGPGSRHDPAPPWADKANPQREFSRLDRFLDMEMHAERNYARASRMLATSRSKKVRAALKQEIVVAREEFREAQKLKARTARPGHTGKGGRFPR
jgi:hypothetical protein